MSNSSSALAGRVRHFVRQWFGDRMRECIHCCECENTVTPWDSHCPRCGQENPARVSPLAAVYLVLAFALLALILSSSILTF